MPVIITLPPVTPDFDAGTIGAWTKQVGDRVEKGDVIAEIETDKALVEVEAEESGVLGRILVEAGQSDVPVHSTIGVLLKEGETEADIDSFLNGADTAVAGESAPAEAEAKTETAAAPAAAAASEPAGETRIFASPLARRIAGQNDVPLSALTGRGPNGRILKADVNDFIDTRGAAPEAPAQAASAQVVPLQQKQAPVSHGDHDAIAHSSMRKVIASRLVESKQTIPHFYLSVDCEIDALLALRASLNAESPEGDGRYKLTVNDFVIKAAALALRDVPEVNASWTDTEVLRYRDVDISVAVSTDDGLITPIVRKADTKGLATLSNQVKELAGRAREGRLKPDEYKGGGFSISNLGMYGINSFSAIINPPQSCILAVGAGEKKPVVRGDELAVATLVNCTLSVDHRVVDGAVGARFLQAFKHYMEHPTHLMLRGG
ncbi:acetyltransferase component of pyruvate dehydrogenase complex [Marinobacterium nitratireducens]|uniref:Acetyltransferase component of pyruvate dehydrogenase complex n=1 Tax=Marinobacterium nitratireducens TaxID=518897 RepID=A0A917ZM61_9GAMM|nr:pyruvate dehydrogenase complex dihydrolipoamide acetyltransferase [Marinobacterium nitratireducens]GGO86311.1 acetyltransferase component of pyruvate dehydrogenase complex [Marinobacterium nitratireducens]